MREEEKEGRLSAVKSGLKKGEILASYIQLNSGVATSNLWRLKAEKVWRGLKKIFLETLIASHTAVEPLKDKVSEERRILCMKIANKYVKIEERKRRREEKEGTS